MERSNEQWIADLQGAGRESALNDLRAILLKGLTAVFVGRIAGDWQATLEDFSQDALLKVLDNLDTFRGDSHFLTWAQKIAVRVAYSDLRRARWQDVSLQSLEPQETGSDYTPPPLTDPAASPEVSVEQQSMLALVQRLIEENLTDRQRTALVGAMVLGMPIEEVARRLGTNRNAVYKLIYDARQNLRQAIEAEGLSPLEILAAFDW